MKARSSAQSSTRITAPLVVVVIVLALFVGGCTTTEVVTANSTPARQSTGTIEDSQRLDISITPLDPGLPDTEEEMEKNYIVADVRRAESQFIAYQLKDTLELTGNWGAVRVTPEPSEAADLVVAGKILLSDGERLRARIKVVDAVGRSWLDKDYEDVASKYSYNRPKEDPFQDFYNNIADDLLDFRERLTNADITEIRQVAKLRYARSLSPDAFGVYLEDHRGRTSIKQLPAENNPMLARVDRIKEREHLFVDTLDDYYGKFYREMRPSYDEWRYATYDEAIRVRLMEKQARNRLLTGAALIAGGIYAASESGTYAGQTAAVGAVAGGIGAIKSGIDRMKEAEIHEQSLRELSASLGAEITPYVLQIEGQTIELTGTADAQYREWQRILKDIYAAETGFPVE